MEEVFVLHFGLLNEEYIGRFCSYKASYGILAGIFFPSVNWDIHIEEIEDLFCDEMLYF